MNQIYTDFSFFSDYYYLKYFWLAGGEVGSKWGFSWGFK